MLTRRATRKRCKPLPTQSYFEYSAEIVAGVYETAIDRKSAYEILKRRAAAAPAAKSNGDTLNSAAYVAGSWGSVRGGLLPFGGGSSGRKDTVVRAVGKSAARTISSQVGRELIRDVLGSLLRKK